MTRALRAVDDLIEAGLVEASDRDSVDDVASRYAVAITPTVADLIDRDDPNDPIARQFVPTAAELVVSNEERPDPIADQAHSPVPGIVHRYPDRVLLKAVHACPVYCRFCFRREMVGPGGEVLDEQALDRAIAYIAEDKAIWEVVLTGGDPLILSTRRLAALMKKLDEIDHVEVARFHTRVPIVDPGRVSEALIESLSTSSKAVWVSLHINHPRELSPTALTAIERLADAGFPLVSQTVLLKGVNDSAAVLEQLFRDLVRARVKPYYLHHADLAPGTSHFRTTVADGQKLVRHLRGRLSGLCQPTYVIDPPDGSGKVPIGPCYDLGTDSTGENPYSDR
ncbi:MAG: lysine-2,3-aminomutase-like protein [Pseudomonadota bacterium]